MMIFEPGKVTERITLLGRPESCLYFLDGASVGEEARAYLPRAIEEAKKTRALIEESYRRTRNVKESTQEITKLLVEWAPEGFLNPEVLAMVTGQMVKYIAKRMEGE